MIRTAIACACLVSAAACSSDSPNPPGTAEASRPQSAPPTVGASADPSDSNPLAHVTIAFTFEGVVYAANGDGSNRRVITRFPEPTSPYGGPYWSPDGSELIIRTETPRSEGAVDGYIFKVNGDGSDLVNLSAVSGSTGDAMPAWSPDGGEIAFASTRPGDSYPRLYVMGADGTRPRLVAPLDFEAQYPTWSTTGSIAFSGVVDRNFEIYSIRPDGSELRRLTDDPSGDNWPTYSPDGAHIAFYSNRDGVDGIWVMNADGSNALRIADGGEPNWSPDGRFITFNCPSAERAAICGIRPDGSGLTTLFEDAGFPAIRP